MDFEDIVIAIIDYFNSEAFLVPAGKVIVVLKILAALFITLLLIDLVLLGIKTRFYKNFFLYNVKGSPYITLPESKVKKRWKKIQRNVKSRNPNAYKLAVIEADKLLGHIFDMGGYTGATYDEQLAGVDGGQIDNIEAIRKAHSVRERIIEDAGYVLSQQEAKELVAEYERALKDLDVQI